jgi:hypothetical protein
MTTQHKLNYVKLHIIEQLRINAYSKSGNFIQNSKTTVQELVSTFLNEEIPLNCPKAAIS